MQHQSGLNAIIQLAYVSTAEKSFSGDPCLKMLEKAREHNGRHEVTGMLISAEGMFLQIIEGEPEAIDGLFERIQKDPRHHSVKLLFREAVDDRDFEQWTMGLLECDVSQLRALPGCNDFFSEGRCVQDLEPGMVKVLLETFRRTRWNLPSEGLPGSGGKCFSSAAHMRDGTQRGFLQSQGQ